MAKMHWNAQMLTLNLKTVPRQCPGSHSGYGLQRLSLDCIPQLPHFEMAGFASDWQHTLTVIKAFYALALFIVRQLVNRTAWWRFVLQHNTKLLIRTTPPCYNNTTLGNRLYTQRKGPNVTNPTCLTCKNCSYKCAAECEHCHTIQHRAVLIIFPLNLQTITITQMLSSGGEERGGRPIDIHRTWKWLKQVTCWDVTF